MIKATIYRNSQNEYTGFSCNGHAGFAENGKDIICSAVSILAINTVNSIELLTTSDIKINEVVQLEFEFVKTPDEKAILLMDSLKLGLESIQKEYGKKFLILEEKIKEV